ncbi:MAG: hypothetical protein JWO15_3956 [Sphingomonadales bacterium]|nr:hypothetical protein [Sphingomonadales bacterium]
MIFGALQRSVDERGAAGTEHAAPHPVVRQVGEVAGA